METIFHINEKLQIKIGRDAHSSCHFLLNTLKVTVITLPAVILYYSTLSGTNRQILTPKRYDEHPRHFYRGIPPGLIYNLNLNNPLVNITTEDNFNIEQSHVHFTN